MRSLCLALLVLVCSAGLAAAELGTARLSLLSGDVQVYSKGNEDWEPAAINLPLQAEDRLWVPEAARTEVHVRREGYIRLNGGSSFDILSLGDESFQFYLNDGQAYLTHRQDSSGQFRLETPLASVICRGQAVLMVDVTESGSTVIAVIKGQAEVASSRGQTRIAAGSVLRIAADRTESIAPLEAPGEWEEWNRARDKELAAGATSRRYLPEDLNDYAFELDAYGSWVEVRDYGYCWRPHRVERDWSPYRLGRWCWLGDDYVWVAYEPWGWAPHHYGRWTFVVSFGWCWVPPPPGAVYWGPGFVGWVHTPSYVAWVPLAPGEVYYGRRHYGPGSRLHSDPGHRLTLRQLYNSRQPDAVTVFRRESFFSGRDDRLKLRGDLFREPGSEPGPPRDKPGRELRRAVERPIPATSRPPERVRRIDPEERRRERAAGRFAPERPAVRDRDQGRERDRGRDRQQVPSPGRRELTPPQPRDAGPGREPAAVPRRPERERNDGRSQPTDVRQAPQPSAPQLRSGQPGAQRGSENNQPRGESRGGESNRGRNELRRQEAPAAVKPGSNVPSAPATGRDGRREGPAPTVQTPQPGQPAVGSQPPLPAVDESRQQRGRQELPAAGEGPGRRDGREERGRQR